MRQALAYNHRPLALTAGVAGIALGALLASGCATSRPPLTPDLPLAGVDGAQEIPVESLAGAPSGLDGRMVRTRGKLAASGSAPEGVWLELEGRQPGSVTRIVVPAATAKPLLGYQGRVLTLALQIKGPTQLSDGRPALSANLLQYAARFSEDAPQSAEVAALEQDVNRAAADVSQQIKSGTTESFGDPGFASGATEPRLRIVFLDPKLDRPRFSVIGPVSIARSGPAAAPTYRYTAITSSPQGEVRESTCVFRIENGALRSISYDEVVRDKHEKVKNQVQLDLTGDYLDKTTRTEVPWPKNIYPSPCLGFALSGFPFEANKKLIRFHLWSDLESAAPMIAMVDGEERVTVPAGTFDTYRMRMRFDEEAFLAQLVLPADIGYDIARSVMEQLRQVDTMFWITTKKPHLVVKTEGPLGPPGITRGQMELVEIPPGAESVRAAP